MTYKIIAVTLILLGALVIAKATTKRSHASTVTVTLPIRCDAEACRNIMPDGSLSNVAVPRPNGSVHQPEGCN